LAVAVIRQKGDSEKKFIEDPIRVKGTLKLWSEVSEDPEHKMFLYIIEDAEVVPIESEALPKELQNAEANQQTSLVQ